MREHRAELLAYPNVHSVDIGFEFTDGQPSGRLAIRVHVDQKQPESALDSSQRLPTEIDGVPVDVIESNPELQLVDRDSHVDPVVGGLTIGNTRSPFIGTLGAIVLDRDSLEPMALSNHHVMVVEPADRDDIIAQPKTLRQADVLGRLSRWDELLDCAVCTVGRPWDTGVADLSSGPVGLKEPLVGSAVVKSGRTTLVTRGIIDGTDGSEFTVVPDPAHPAPGTEISAGGDSGSIWMASADSYAVGLHYAGETDPSPAKERAWAKLMVAVSEALNVGIFTGAAIGRCRVGRPATVLARTRPGAPCSIVVRYPSGRRSAAQGLDAATADANGWVQWTWRVGASTTRHNAGTGHERGDPVEAILTLDGVEQTVERVLEGNPTT